MGYAQIILLARSFACIHHTGADVNRPYTVVVPSLLPATEPNAEYIDGTLIHLMIKIYSDGVLTQQISSLKEGMI